MEAVCSLFVQVFFYYIYISVLEIPLSRGGWVEFPLTDLTLTHLWDCPKPGPGFPTSYVIGFFYVQLVEVRGDCS